MSNSYRIIPIFVPHKGCPFDCVFCNQKKITGLSTDITKNDVEKIIENYLSTVPVTNKELEVAFYGGSFTAIDKDIQQELLEVVHKYKKRGKIDRIRLSTRPDYIDSSRLELLKKYNVDIIELGVQSMCDDVLEKSNRGHSSNDVKKAVKKIRKYEFKLGLQMMIGLPGDTKEKTQKTGLEIVKLKPDFVRIYPTLVVKGTYLEKLYERGIYIPLTVEETINITSELLMIFKYYDIPVIRIGLQPTENITFGKDVIAGPFHPSIRQLVESNIYRIVIEKYFNRSNMVDKEIDIGINERKISSFVGQNRENIKLIKQKYHIEISKIIKEDISDEYINIYSNNKNDKININEYIRLYLLERNLLRKVEYIY